MLTRLTIRNFKRLGKVEVELGNPVVLTGPNNSGKTSAMQALALWDIGVKRWNEKRAGRSAPGKRTGVTINRKDLFAVPNPNARHLWRDLRVRDLRRVDGRPRTRNVRIDVIVEGVNEDMHWKCGFEFDYANEESFYCRPLRLDDGKHPERMPVPHQADAARIAFLPPMSGLAANETRLDQGAVNVRVGEGRTAEILRNLCFRVADQNPDRWTSLVEQIRELFGVTLEEPRYVEERGEITMGYRERGMTLDLSSNGRGLQQTLLVLAYMHANPGAIILLEEPDAHLEFLRQRQIFGLITDSASESGSQIIAATHSEALLNEAAGRDLVIAFIGEPRRIGVGQSEALKGLLEIGFDQHFQAEQTGWVLYLEGSSDLAILRTFAKKLGKRAAAQALARPFVRYVGNRPSSAGRHFHCLWKALPDLKGVALFGRLDVGIRSNPSLEHLVWKRREIANYLCTRRTLEDYARTSGVTSGPGCLFASTEVSKRLTAMGEAVDEVGKALETLGKELPCSGDAKASDDFLAPLFRTYFEKIGIPNLMAKKTFYELADHVPEDEIDPEIGEKLDAIARVAESAAPAAKGRLAGIA